MTMDLPFRLILAVFVSGLLLLLTTIQASAHKGHQQPDSEPAQEELIVDDHMESNADEADAHDETSSTTDEADSDHHGGADKGTKTFSERLTSWLGSFHPAVVHFPIGLLLAALFGELLFMATGQPTYASIVRYCIWIGALGALTAAPLGWFSAGFQLTDAKEIITTHRWVGTSASVWSIFLLAILSRTKPSGSRTLLRVALVVGAGLVAYNGYLGGLIVHGLDAHAF